MRKLMLAAAFVFGLPAFSSAAPCVPNSLLGYIGLGSGGCEIGGATFFGFSSGPSFFGGTPIASSQVTVIPVNLALGPRLDFALTGNAGPGNVLGVAIGYSISGLPLVGSSLSMSGAAAAGDGVVTAVEDLCSGGTFASDPSNCSTPLPISLVVAQDSFGPAGPDAKSFTASSFFDVFVDITIDGGLSGSAALGGPQSPGTVTNQFVTSTPSAPIPEPSTVGLVCSGLLVLWISRRRGGIRTEARLKNNR